jgi:DNA polymerase
VSGEPIRDFASWRHRARTLLAAQTPPEAVTWVDESERTAVLPLELQASRQPAHAGVLKLPRELLALLQTCACHRNPNKWTLMYRLVWRAQHGERHVLQLAADRDVRELQAMARAIHHDCHKMHAFVRFREVAGEEGQPRYVAWFEPQHLILRRVAAFFVDRFASMHWTIVTPDGAVQWDRHSLRFLDEVDAPELPGHDDKEELWRAYYASIFNPARVNRRATAQHMPKRYWRNLPEAADIGQLAAAAPARALAMLTTQPNDSDRWAHAAPASASIEDSETLPAAVARCTRCPLWEHATQAVCGLGPLPAALMLVGEQPGDEEDLKGRPFVGPAGRLLDRALAAAGIERSTIYLTNAVKHFKWEPRGKRRLHKTPAQAEIAACMDWLEQEIGQAQPRVIVALGATALTALLRRRESIAQARGEQLTHASGARIVATYHPAAILRAGTDAETELFEALCGDLRVAKDLTH